MTAHSPAVWLSFTALVVALLILDLGVLNRRSHVLSMREAFTWSAGLISLSLLFGGFLWWREGLTHALEYYTGYLIELSLSVDNLFVFILIFQYFAVPAELQPRVLKWGIVGAIVMRGVMIALGAILLERFTWIIYVFGGILILTGLKMFRGGDERIEPEKNPVVRIARRILPVTPAYAGQSFIIRTHGGWYATPLLLVVLMIEWSDLVFAIDSIPAIFAVTRDPFIVYTSNAFAILGLRALYFLLADLKNRFRYLKLGVAAILVFIGVKMVLSGWFHLPTAISLAVIVLFLATAIWASLRTQPASAAE
jgi:tellurite resistance protein TerC